MKASQQKANKHMRLLHTHCICLNECCRGADEAARHDTLSAQHSSCNKLLQPDFKPLDLCLNRKAVANHMHSRQMRLTSCRCLLFPNQCVRRHVIRICQLRRELQQLAAQRVRWRRSIKQHVSPRRQLPLLLLLLLGPAAAAAASEGVHAAPCNIHRECCCCCAAAGSVAEVWRRALLCCRAAAAACEWVAEASRDGHVCCAWGGALGARVVDDELDDLQAGSQGQWRASVSCCCVPLMIADLCQHSALSQYNHRYPTELRQ